MTVQHFHRDYRTLTTSLMLDTLGASLREIRRADGATWTEVGWEIGKSKDRAARYAAGGADMGAASFVLGCRAWDGRFANDVLALVGMRLAPIGADSAPVGVTSLRALADLMSAKAAALEDGQIDDREIAAMWPLIEAVGRQIDQLRARRAASLRHLPAYDTS